MKKIVLTFGLIAGAIMAGMLIVALIFQDQIGFERGAIVGHTSMVLAFLMTYFGARAYRDGVQNGQIGFARALKVCLLISAVAIACYVVAWEIVFYNFMPDFGEKYMAFAIEQVRQSGASEAQIAAQTKELSQFFESYKNPLVNIAITILEPLGIALIMSLLSAYLVSRKKAATV